MNNSDAETKETLFSLNNLTLRYQERAAIKKLSLTIHRGERIALVGQSGAGKSTLLKHLRSLQQKNCAWCPQQHGLVPMLSVFHNIYMGALQRHSVFYNLANLIKPLAQPRHEIEKLCEKLQLDNPLVSTVDQLSGGQQQRVAIGRALYQQQSIFLGDEPISAVDDYQAESLLQLISHQHETYILALHDVELALRACDRIIGLKKGEIVIDSPSHELCAADLASLYL